MSEFSSGSDGGMEMGSSGGESGSTGEVSGGGETSASAGEVSSGTESSSTGEVSSGTESSSTGEVSGGGESSASAGEVSSGTKSGSTGEVSGGISSPAGEVGEKGAENFSAETGRMEIASHETSRGMNQVLETPETLEQAQISVENYHQQSIAQILDLNGKYISESDRERISNGVDSIKVVEDDPYMSHTGSYLYAGGKSHMEVAAQSEQQMERTVKHETNHFASKNREIIVPEPDKKGYTVYQTVGTRQTSWFHSNETGQNSNFSTKGRGLNEGLTTMYTNQQLFELSKEKGEAAERQGIYSHATELCNQLEEIVGTDTLKEAYYGGNLQGLEAKVDSLAGDKGYESLRDCLDRTLSKDYAERVQAMREAQTILAKMYEEGARKE